MEHVLNANQDNMPGGTNVNDAPQKYKSTLVNDSLEESRNNEKNDEKECIDKVMNDNLALDKNIEKPSYKVFLVGDWFPRCPKSGRFESKFEKVFFLQSGLMEWMGLHLIEVDELPMLLINHSC